MPCSSTRYLQFRSSSVRYLQLCWVPWRTLYMQTRSCEVRWASRSHKPTTVNLDLRLSRLASFLHVQKLFFTNIWGVVCANKFIFEFTNFGEWTKCTHGFTLQSDLVPPEQGAGSWQLDVTRLFPLLVLEQRAWDKATSLLSCILECRGEPQWAPH